MKDTGRTKLIDTLWQQGKTIGEINEEFHLITVLPEKLKGITKNTIVDFTARYQGAFEFQKITIPRLASSGFYILIEGKRSKRALKYTTFKFLNIYREN